MTWTEIYAAHFRELAEHEVDSWKSEIRRHVPDAKEGEIAEAASKLAAKWNSNFPYKAKDLISQVRHDRAERMREHEANKADCVYCGGSGWMLAPVTVVNCRVRSIGHFEMPGKQYTEQRIPCFCDAGKSIAANVILKKLHGNSDAMKAGKDRLYNEARTAAQFIDALHWLERLRYTSSAYRLPAQEREEMDQYVAELKDRLPSEKSIARAMTSKPRYPYPASTGPVIYN